MGRATDAVSAGLTEEQLTYAELDAKTNQLVELILSQGPDSKGVLAVYADRSPRLLVSLLATIKAGFAFHIIDPKYPIQRIVDCLNYVRAVGILNGSTDLGAVERLWGMFAAQKRSFLD